MPDHFEGKEPTDWDQLNTAFPVPSALQDKVQSLLFQLNYRGYPLCYTRMGCGCQNCIDMQDSNVPYAHEIMNKIELAGVPKPGNARRIIDHEIEYVVQNDITSAVSVIQH